MRGMPATGDEFRAFTSSCDVGYPIGRALQTTKRKRLVIRVRDQLIAENIAGLALVVSCPPPTNIPVHVRQLNAIPTAISGLYRVHVFSSCRLVNIHRLFFNAPTNSPPLAIMSLCDRVFAPLLIEIMRPFST